MKLETKSSCTQCRNCLENCPKASSFSMFNCKHCSEPECVEACPENAFKEVIEGVYAVNEEKCTGCGRCAEACPWNAIVIEKGKAKKCDLCEGSPECIQACPINALELEKTLEDKEILEEILGWRKKKGEYESNQYEPTSQEAILLEETKKIYREWVKEEDIDLISVLEEYSQETGLSLERNQKKRLLDLLEKEVKGLSILDTLLEEKEIEEIAVTGKNNPVKVFHAKKGWLETDLAFTSEQKIKQLINKIGQKLGRRITLQNPRMNAVLEDGSRIHASIPPVSEQPSMTIRKFKEKVFTPKKLEELGTASAELLAFLWMAIKANQNTLIIGSTGSGKTTTLNALTAFVPKEERMILVEETPEIKMNHEHHVRLTTSDETRMNELVNDTLRMRPDRVIVSEVRTEEEVKALMNTMLAGQGKSSFSTFHANNAEQALTRLQKLGVKRSDLASLDVIVTQKRWENQGTGLKEKRKITEVTEVKEDLETNQVFDYAFSEDEWNRGKSEVVKKESKKFFDSFEEELEERTEKIREGSEKFEGFMEEIHGSS